MEELIKMVKDGNEKAFNKLVIILKDDLYKIAKMRLNCEEDINDAVQETIIQAYKYIKKIRNVQFFKTWIIKVLINNCNRIYNKNYKNTSVEYNENVVCDTYVLSNDSKIKNIDFYILIEKLKYKERITLILYYLLEFTTKEIGKVLHEPEGTVKSRLVRARMKLKNFLGEGENSE